MQRSTYQQRHMTGVTLLQSRRQDNSLVGYKFERGGAHLIALIAVGINSVLVWNIVSAFLVVAADFQGLQSHNAVP